MYVTVKDQHRDTEIAENINRLGSCRIQRASVSKLPFSDNTFDLVTAVETQYYWPDLIKDMKEILRVLKPDVTPPGAPGNYTSVELFEERDKGWLCVTGRKP